MTEIHFPPGNGRAAAAPDGDNLIGLTRAQLAARLAESGLVPEGQARMRARQLWNWLYVRGAARFADMTNLSKELRAGLAERFSAARPEIVSAQTSTDGTRKWLLRLGPGKEVETVFIPDGERGTLCISSQVGCTLNCRFCHTGTQPLVHNLTPREIVAQVLVARDALEEWPGAGGRLERRQLTNVVMMGMGEPLYNFENVKAGLAIVADGDGLGLGKRRVTLSTSGVVPMIPRVGGEMGVMLAISLHAVRDDLR
ncbi:MAG: 23S rRNA (adenine(2503)-C(2))-methyltransferase RlmN, partial [Alphaproteobacteria bacterium]